MHPVEALGRYGPVALVPLAWTFAGLALVAAGQTASVTLAAFQNT